MCIFAAAFSIISQITRVLLNLINKQESPPAWTQEAYRPPRGHSNFLLFRWGGGGIPWQIFFFQSEHVSSQIWCQKIFPLLGGGGSLDKKIFFPVWTCIKPNLVSKIFPFTETRIPPPPRPRLNQPTWKSETWDPPLPLPCPRLDQCTWKSETWDPPHPRLDQPTWKIWDLGPPPSPPPVQGWISLLENLRPGTPPPKCEQTETITFPHPSDGGR